jgi:cell shape-determining protein MreC
MLLTWLTLAGFIVLLGPQKITGKFQGAFAHIFRIPLRMGRAVTLSAHVVESPGYEFESREHQYQNHIANLAAEIEEKNRQIELLAGLRQRKYALEGAVLVTADVISATIEGTRNELIINRGQSDGLSAGQFVLGENSIVGVVSGVWSRTARVRLVTDVASKLPVTVEGLEKSVWMFGRGNGQAKALWAKKKVPPGTNVMVQKNPGRLDCAMIAGKVKHCDRNEQNALLWDITVKPACDVVMLRSVTVIVMNPAPTLFSRKDLQDE